MSVYDTDDKGYLYMGSGKESARCCIAASSLCSVGPYPKREIVSATVGPA
jgi:hypothetical protein